MPNFLYFLHQREDKIDNISSKKKTSLQIDKYKENTTSYDNLYFWYWNFTFISRGIYLALYIRFDKFRGQRSLKQKLEFVFPVSFVLFEQLLFTKVFFW